MNEDSEGEKWEWLPEGNRWAKGGAIPLASVDFAFLPSPGEDRPRGLSGFFRAKPRIGSEEHVLAIVPAATHRWGGFAVRLEGDPPRLRLGCR